MFVRFITSKLLRVIVCAAPFVKSKCTKKQKYFL